MIEEVRNDNDSKYINIIIVKEKFGKNGIVTEGR